MRILLDEQLPRQLARQLRGNQVRTVQQRGWNGLGNGELLRQAAAGGFEIFVTADQNLQFQQNLMGSALGVIVLIAGVISSKISLRSSRLCSRRFAAWHREKCG